MAFLSRVLGPYAPRLKMRILLRVGLAVLLADLVTKMAAVFILVEGCPVSFGFGSLQLTFNDPLMGAGLVRFMETYAIRMIDVFVASLVGVVASLLSFWWINPEWTPVRKSCAFVFGIMAPMLGALEGSRVLASDFPVSPMWIFVVRGIGGLCTWVVAMRLARSRVLFLGFALVFAGNFSNLICFSEKGIVDFLRIPALSWWFGTFNLADVSISLFNVLLIAYLPLEFLARLPVIGRMTLIQRLCAPLGGEGERGGSVGLGGNERGAL